MEPPTKGSAKRRTFLGALLLFLVASVAAVAAMLRIMGGRSFRPEWLSSPIDVFRQRRAYLGALAGAAGPTEARAAAEVVKVSGRGLFASEGRPRPGAVAKMTDRAICALTGQQTLGEAFKTLAAPTDRVAVRWPGVVHQEVVDTVVRGLLEAGVPAGRITLYKSGSDEIGQGIKRRIAPSGQEVDVEGGVFANAAVHVGSHRVRLARALWECSALITIASLNTHHHAEISGALKTHYGSVDQPAALHIPMSYNCALINNLPQIKDSTRLVLLDALRPSLEGHPDAPIERHYQEMDVILASRDPVAMDTVGLQLLREGRRAHGLPHQLPFGQRIVTRAGELGLGVHEPDRIKTVQIKVKVKG